MDFGSANMPSIITCVAAQRAQPRECYICGRNIILLCERAIVGNPQRAVHAAHGLCVLHLTAANDDGDAGASADALRAEWWAQPATNQTAEPRTAATDGGEAGPMLDPHSLLDNLWGGKSGAKLTEVGSGEYDVPQVPVFQGSKPCWGHTSTRKARTLSLVTLGGGAAAPSSCDVNSSPSRALEAGTAMTCCTAAGGMVVRCSAPPILPT